jgi:hypothetical protein
LLKPQYHAQTNGGFVGPAQPEWRRAQPTDSVSNKPVNGQGQPGRPGHGTEIRQVTGREVQIIRSPQHEHHRGQQPGGQTQTAPRRPGVRECAGEKHVQRDAPVDGPVQRQQQEPGIGRIPQRGLGSPKERRAGKDVQIPEGQIALPDKQKRRARRENHDTRRGQIPQSGIGYGDCQSPVSIGQHFFRNWGLTVPSTGRLTTCPTV